MFGNRIATTTKPAFVAKKGQLEALKRKGKEPKVLPKKEKENY